MAEELTKKQSNGIWYKIIIYTNTIIIVWFYFVSATSYINVIWMNLVVSWAPYKINNINSETKQQQNRNKFPLQNRIFQLVNKQTK